MHVRVAILANSDFAISLADSEMFYSCVFFYFVLDTGISAQCEVT